MLLRMAMRLLYYLSHYLAYNSCYRRHFGGAADDANHAQNNATISPGQLLIGHYYRYAKKPITGRFSTQNANIKMPLTVTPPLTMLPQNRSPISAASRRSFMIIAMIALGA